MRNEREKHNDSLLIGEMIGASIVGLFTLALPFILWYLFKFMDFIRSENFKGFMIGFSLCPLWVFIFLKVHKKITTRKVKKG